MQKGQSRLHLKQNPWPSSPKTDGHRLENKTCSRSSALLERFEVAITSLWCRSLGNLVQVPPAPVRMWSHQPGTFPDVAGSFLGPGAS